MGADQARDFGGLPRWLRCGFDKVTSAHLHRSVLRSRQEPRSRRHAARRLAADRDEHHSRLHALHFLDLEPANVAAVRAEIGEQYPRHRATIISEPRDCNAALPTLLGRLPRDGATFAFLDPGGVNLEWPTVRALARHKGNHRWKVEQFILFPYNFGIARMLNPDNSTFFARMSPTLDAIFGNDEWKQDLQHRGKRVRGDDLRQRLTERYMGQLRGELGYGHVFERLISTPNGHPLYYLIYASDHDVGGEIMRHSFGKDDHGGQLAMLRAEYRSMRQSRYAPVPGWDRFEDRLRALAEDETEPPQPE